MNHAGLAPSPGVPLATRRGHARIGDIEVLRGVAILMVLVEHMPSNLVVWHSHLLAFLDRYCRGWVGVDLFFVISGFVIARGLLPLHENAPDGMHYARGIVAFWIRRAWRLLPSAWLWLVVPLATSIWFNRSGVFLAPQSNFTGLATGVLDIANFRLAATFGKEAWVAFPYWSLSLEEQFYLLLPLLLFVTGRWLPVAMSTVLALQFIPAATPLDMMIRSGALAAGVLVACASGTRIWRLCEPTGLAHSASARAAVLLMPLVLMGALGSDQLRLANFRLGLIAVLGGLLVWIASYDQGLLVRPKFPRRVLIWFGSRSYSLYLTHVPAYFATREIWFRVSPPGTVFGGQFALRFALTAGLLVFALAEANYRFVEQPLRRRGNRISDSFARRPLPQ